MKWRILRLVISLSILLLTLITIEMVTWSFSSFVSRSIYTNAGASSETHTNSDFIEPPLVEWNATYGGTGSDGISSLVQTRDGGYALVGSTNSYGAGENDIWLIKADITGNPLWNRTYPWPLGGGGVSLIQTDDDGYALVGVIIVEPHHCQMALFIKTDKDGRMQWNRTYFTEDDNSVAYSVIQTRDGGYALCGYVTIFNGGPSRFFLIKANIHGNTQWIETYAATDAANAQTVIQTNDGGYALMGTEGPLLGPYDCFLVKTDAQGKMLWNRTYGGPMTEWGQSLVQSDDGGYALLCTTNSYGAGSSDLYLIKTDADGEVQWNVIYGGTGNDGVQYGFVQTHDGGYAIAGTTNSFGAGGYDAWLIKADADGNVVWNQTCGDVGNESARDLIQTDDGGYAFAGNKDSDGWLVKIAAENITFHDVDVADFRTSKTGCLPAPCVGQNLTTNVVVIIKNSGSYLEISNVTIFVDDTVIGTADEVSLAPGLSIVINFAWNTSGTAIGSHILKASASPVSGENDTSDNMQYEWILVTGPGDVNGDFVVDIFDAVLLAGGFNSMPGSPNWSPNVDINDDNIVDIFDAVILANHFNQHYP